MTAARPEFTSLSTPPIPSEGYEGSGPVAAVCVAVLELDQGLNTLSINSKHSGSVDSPCQCCSADAVAVYVLQTLLRLELFFSDSSAYCSCEHCEKHRAPRLLTTGLSAVD